MQLPVMCRENAGKPMAFEVERGGRRRRTQGPDPHRDPRREPPLELDPELNQEVDVPGLGLCYPVSPRVVAVKPDSPAARAGIKAGDVINSMTIKPSKSAKTSGREAGRLGARRAPSTSTTDHPPGSAPSAACRSCATSTSSWW